MRLRRPLVLPVLLLLAPIASADTITGKVVDSNGVGVAGVNINAFEVSSGDEVTLFNDGTDASGNFVTTIPPGRYDIEFIPPAPPTTTHLVGYVLDTLVAGTQSLGNVALPPGVPLGGRVVDASLTPYANVNLDVLDETTGDDLRLQNDFTNAAGDFLVAVPVGPIRLTFKGQVATPHALAPLRTSIVTAGPTNLGDVTLELGYHVTGFVVDPSFVGVKDCDIDFIDTTTGLKIFSVGDNTDDFGAFDVVTPLGSYDMNVCPPFDEELVAESVPVNVTGNVSAGVVSLQSGVVLSGRVTDFNGNRMQNADVDVRVASTGAPILTCSDNTDSNGDYAVVVPTGTLRVTFNPPPSSVGLGPDVHPSVVVSSNTTLDGVLPQACSGSSYGIGLAGSGGLVPVLGESGVPAGSSSSYDWELSNGLGGGFTILIAGTAPASIPIGGGTLLVGITPGTYVRFSMTLSGPAGVPGAGAATVAIPPSLVAGFTLYGQFAVNDLAAPKNWAMSNGFSVFVCP